MDRKFYRTLAHIAVPIIIQEFINSFVNILDTFMIGSLGVHEITAVGLANQLFFLFALLTFGINSGSSILMGQFWGNKEPENVKKVLGICLCGSMISGSIFASLALFAPELVMSIYSKDPKVIAIGADYLRTIWPSYLLVSFSMSLSTAQKSTRHTKVPMLTTFIALTGNAIMNYIFIFVLHKGVVGAAYGTVIARTIELAALLAIIYGFKLPIAPKPSELFAGDKQFLKSFLTVTIPVILNEFIWSLGTSIYHIAYKYCGTEAQGAFQISSSVQNLFMVIGMSVGSATGIMISNTLGAGDTDRAITYSRRFMKFAIVIGAVTGLGLYLCAPLIVNIFNVSAAVRLQAIKIMHVVALVIVAKIFTYTTIVGILRSGGDTWYCFILDTVTVWCVGIPCAFLGAVVLQLPIHYVVLMVGAEEIAKIFISGRRVLNNKWARQLV